MHDSDSPAAVTPTVSRILEDMTASVDAIGKAVALPPDAYTSEEFFAFERESVFDRSWLFLCHESEVAPGHAVAVNILDEPLLVTRGDDGTVHVLSAVCQHRGFTLSEEHVSGRNVRCPYHYWTYGLDGKLLGAPSMTPEHELEQLKRNVCLPNLRCEVWHGLVFANFDPQAAPLGPSLERVEEVVRTHRFEDLVCATSVDLEALPYNWKNMLENALEEYHTMYVHKGFHENAPPNLVEHGTFERGDGAVYRHAGLIIKGGEDVPGRPTFPVIEGLREHDRGYFIFVAIPPSLFAVVYPHGLKTFRVLPRSAGRIDMRISFAFPRSTVELPDFPSMLERQVAFIDMIDQPDVESNSRIFRGLKSRYAPRGPLAPQEATLPQLYEWLLEQYQANPAHNVETV